MQLYLGISFLSSTTMPPHNLATITFIESMAQDQLRFEVIFTKQAKVLRADKPRFDAAMAKI
jgi:hypothetical protein